jgi:hypothetical protein
MSTTRVGDAACRRNTRRNPRRGTCTCGGRRALRLRASATARPAAVGHHPVVGCEHCAGMVTRAPRVFGVEHASEALCARHRFARSRPTWARCGKSNAPGSHRRRRAWFSYRPAHGVTCAVEPSPMRRGLKPAISANKLLVRWLRGAHRTSPLGMGLRHRRATLPGAARGRAHDWPSRPTLGGSPAPRVRSVRGHRTARRLPGAGTRLAEMAPVRPCGTAPTGLGLLSVLTRLDTGLYLTGGTTASRVYLQHRFSDDLSSPTTIAGSAFGRDAWAVR